MEREWGYIVLDIKEGQEEEWENGKEDRRKDSKTNGIALHRNNLKVSPFGVCQISLHFLVICIIRIHFDKNHKSIGYT